MTLSCFGWLMIGVVLGACFGAVAGYCTGRWEKQCEAKKKAPVTARTRSCANCGRDCGEAGKDPTGYCLGWKGKKE